MSETKTSQASNPGKVLEAVYREQWPKLLSVLVRIFGPQNLELAEDVLQSAFQKAVDVWREQGIPENPAGWLLRAAKNQAIDAVRSERTRRKFASDLSYQLDSDWTVTGTIEREFSEENIDDDHLRMIFLCASADLAPENRIPLMLRTLCGFSIPAIGRALLLPEAAVKKRLVRSRERLAGHAFELPPLDRLADSMDSVHTVIYLLFNEGFHSSEGDAMRLDLCREALHLGQLLMSTPRIVNRDTVGLLSLMSFHFARAEARVDADGHNVPIDRQDRSKWSASGIEAGRQLLRVAASVTPGASGRFFVEAAIAGEHCRARAFASTNWSRIGELYEELSGITSSPLVELNRAVAIGYAGDLERAIRLVEELTKHPTLEKSHLPNAALAHFFAKQGKAVEARRFVDLSIERGGTPHEKRLLREQVERLLGES